MLQYRDFCQGFGVGFVSLGLSLRLGLTLILFYKSSSVLTKVGSGKKKRLTDDYKVRRHMRTLQRRCLLCRCPCLSIIVLCSGVSCVFCLRVKMGQQWCAAVCRVPV